MKIIEQSNTINEIAPKFYNNKLYVRIKNNYVNDNLNKQETKEGNTENERTIHGILYTPSHLDIFDKNSPIMSSNFYGFSSLLLNVGLFFSLIIPIVNFLEKGYFLDTELLESMFRKFPLLIFLCLKIFLFSFVPYFVYYLYRNKKITILALLILQSLSEIWIIIFTFLSCLYIQFTVIPCGFVISISYIFFMKMHSYVFTNLEYARGNPNDHLMKYKNLNLKNYINFMMCPSLIYKFNFRRIKKFRPKYFAQKIICLILTVIIEYTTYTVFIAPTVHRINNISFLEAVIRLIFPCLIIFLASFYLIFECVCNLFAEITKFGEREFYQDWWNSTIWYEFSRKWNNVVQAWLFKHVYLVAKNSYKLNKFKACVLTYLVSAIFHELLMIACFHTCKFYLFFLMFLQIPLSWFGEQFYKNKPIGNIIFWSNILLGMPVIFISYANEINKIY